ncbi:hypothetical protein Tco_1054443 [Tanacetum coccineum]|uniref:Uncharacterized protein n=1 Tax=Tanacetum coccineum TaxID=301880 RepID=A0ABQ5GWS8_9ASTR
MSSFMASQDARLSKFEADFKQQQGEMTNKIDTFLKAINDRIMGALPSDMVKNSRLNVNYTSPVLSTRSYPTKDPQCSSHIHRSINAIIMCSKQTNKSQNDQPQVKTQTVNKDGALPSKGIKSPSKLLSPKYLSQSSLREQNRKSSSPKRVHFINIITVSRRDDKPRETGMVKPNIKGNDHELIVKVKKECKESEEEGNGEEDDPKHININPPSPLDPSISFITEKV